MNIGAVWIRESKDGGEKYLSCIMSVPFLGKINFAIFKNKEKAKDAQPDYHIVWSEAKDKKESKKADMNNFNDQTPF